MSNPDLGWDATPEEPYYETKSRQQLVVFFQTNHRRRWLKLQREYRWLYDEMRKMGLNPEDARFLL